MSISHSRLVCRRPEPTRRKKAHTNWNKFVHAPPTIEYLHTYTHRTATCYQLPAAAAASSTSYATQRAKHVIMFYIHTFNIHKYTLWTPYTSARERFMGQRNILMVFIPFHLLFFLLLLFHHSDFGAQGVSSDFIYSVLSDSTIYLWMSLLHIETTFSLNLNAIKCRRRDWNRFSAMTM